MNKPKTTQPQTKQVQGRDLFATPYYATDLLVPYIPASVYKIWEPACGYGKISTRLEQYGFAVVGTDLNQGVDFLEPQKDIFGYQAIITNPPFSLKYKFIDKAIEYDVPFAFLIPFDMCSKMANLFMNYGIQGLVPTRRIDYITPTQKENSSAQFHSFWLTRYFNLPDQLTFVELSLNDKENI